MRGELPSGLCISHQLCWPLRRVAEYRIEWGETYQLRTILMRGNSCESSASNNNSRWRRSALTRESLSGRMFWHLLGKYLGVKLWGHRVNVWLTLKETSNIFSELIFYFTPWPVGIWVSVSSHFIRIWIMLDS